METPNFSTLKKSPSACRMPLLVTPSRSISFIIPSREPIMKELSKRRQSAEGDVMSRLSQETKTFLKLQKDMPHPNASDPSAGCALVKAYQEARRIQTKLVNDFEAAKKVKSIVDRYRRLRQIIKEATLEQHLHVLHQGARHHCTCSLSRARAFRRHRSYGKDRVTGLDGTKGGNGGVRGASSRKSQRSGSHKKSGSLLTHELTTGDTRTIKVAAIEFDDHIRYRNCIVLLQRHLEKLSREYEESKRFWFPVRRYTAMKTMLEEITKAKLD